MLFSYLQLLHRAQTSNSKECGDMVVPPDLLAGTVHTVKKHSGVPAAPLHPCSVLHVGACLCNALLFARQAWLHARAVSTAPVCM